MRQGNRAPAKEKESNKSQAEKTDCKEIMWKVAVLIVKNQKNKIFFEVKQ